jgi:5-methylcytosine-specific restriction endonuclease McrA
MAKACPICFAPTPDGRACARHPRAHRPDARRGYSDTAEYRRVRDEVLAAHGSRCVYCGADVLTPAGAPGHADNPLELAHVIPHADGGPFTVENLRPAHRSCNRRAGRAPLMEV